MKKKLQLIPLLNFFAESLREAEADRRSGNRDAFTDLAALKAELAL